MMRLPIGDVIQKQRGVGRALANHRADLQQRRQNRGGAEGGADRCLPPWLLAETDENERQQYRHAGDADLKVREEQKTGEEGHRSEVAAQEVADRE